MGEIYGIHLRDELRWHDVHRKFHNDWFRHSKADGEREFTDTQTAW
jgi:hypothetical protein